MNAVHGWSNRIDECCLHEFLHDSWIGEGKSGIGDQRYEDVVGVQTDVSF